MDVTLDFCCAKQPHVLQRPVDGGVALLDMSTGRMFALNGTGARLWTLLQSCSTLRQASQQMVAAYPAAPRQSIEDDLLALARELDNRGLVRIEAAAVSDCERRP